VDQIDTATRKAIRVTDVWGNEISHQNLNTSFLGETPAGVASLSAVYDTTKRDILGQKVGTLTVRVSGAGQSGELQVEVVAGPLTVELVDPRPK
jgi:hypothetical protein